MKECILVVEDDLGISRLLSLELSHEGYDVKCVTDGQNGLDEATKNEYDLIILDVMLPSLNGIELLRRLRQEKSTPVLILTARDQIVDKVAGLDLGASDYVTKPFDIAELLARIRANLRKSKPSVALTIGPLSVDLQSRTVTVNGQEVILTKKEFDLLVFLMQNEGNVISREKIVEQVWGFEYFGNTNLVDVYIRYLRVKVEHEFGIKLIKTVRGSGYTIKK